MNECAIQARQFVLMSYSKYSSRVLYGEKAIGVLILFNTYKERGRQSAPSDDTARCITSALSSQQRTFRSDPSSILRCVRHASKDVLETLRWTAGQSPFSGYYVHLQMWNTKTARFLHFTRTYCFRSRDREHRRHSRQQRTSSTYVTLVVMFFFLLKKLNKRSASY
jgi:hypothetical protein